MPSKHTFLQLAPFLLLAFYTLTLDLVAAQFAVYPNASDLIPTPKDPACATALSQTAQCSTLIFNTLPSTIGPRFVFNQTDLDSLCTAACYSSLIQITESVDANCAGWPSVHGDTAYIPSFNWRYLEYTYNLTCAVDPVTSQYCTLQLQTSAYFNNSNTDILSLPNSQLCQPCALSVLTNQMTSSFGYDPTFATNWSTIQSRCNYQANNTIPPSLVLPSGTLGNGTYANVTSSPSPQPASNASCVYGSYTVSSGDTCQSIAAAKSLSLDQLISINGLDRNCTTLPPPGRSICLSGACSTYTVQNGDTCYSIIAAKNVTWTQLLSWNPQFDSYCSNIAQSIGKDICISPPGGGYAPTSTLAPVTGSPTALATPTGPVGPGTNRQQCGEYYTVQTGDTCPKILQLFAITNATFHALNPLINSDCSNLYANFSYCVGLYGNLTTTSSFATPTQTSNMLYYFAFSDFPYGVGFATGNATAPAAETSNGFPSTTSPPQPTFTVAQGSLNSTYCLQYYEVQSGDSCFTIQQVYNLKQTDFLRWNPELNSDCTNLLLGLAYCVNGPLLFPSGTYTSESITPLLSASPTSSSANASPTPTANNCTQTYTVVSGDTCSAIDSTFGLTLAQLLSMNPAINSNCSNLSVGQVLCVAGGSTPSSTSASPTPTPTSTCTQSYTVVSGDTCSAIASRFGITVTQLEQENPSINTDCSNLSIGQVLCVDAGTTPTSTLTSTSASATPTAPACTQSYTVASGDTCNAIEGTFGITLDQLITMNPSINAACTNIFVGQVLCVLSGQIQKCSTTHIVASGDTCSSIDTAFNITFAQLQSLNPSIDNSCSNIQVGQNLCVVQ